MHIIEIIGINFMSRNDAKAQRRRVLAALRAKFLLPIFSNADFLVWILFIFVNVSTALSLVAYIRSLYGSSMGFSSGMVLIFARR